MSSWHGLNSRRVGALLVVLAVGILSNCDQSVQPTSVSNASSDAIRFTPAYSALNDDPTLSGFALAAVDAKGNVKPITTLKRDYTDTGPGPYVPHIFAYGSGKLAHFIPAPFNAHTVELTLPVGSPAQIEVVDLRTGETSRYPAPKDVSPYRDNYLSMTPFSPDGEQILIPGGSSEYILNLESNQITSIPNLAPFSIIGWSADNQLIYAHVIKPTAQGGGDTVEQASPQGHIVELDLLDSNNIYNEMLSSNDKSLYYEAMTSTQPLPSPGPDGFSMVNLIERYDFASGINTAITSPTAGDYFPVGYRSFTLSPDGASIAYIEYTPYSAQNPYAARATIWRMDLSRNVAPTKVIGGLYNPFRLTWCGDNLYYYDGGPDWRGWQGVRVAGGTAVRIEGEILGCAP